LRKRTKKSETHWTEIFVLLFAATSEFAFWVDWVLIDSEVGFEEELGVMDDWEWNEGGSLDCDYGNFYELTWEMMGNFLVCLFNPGAFEIICLCLLIMGIFLEDSGCLQKKMSEL
jgi:hypothetical protein